MSWLYSQALVEASWEGQSLDGVPSAPSSSTPTPLAFCASGRMMAYSRLSRSGMVTFGSLTESDGEAVLTSFLEAFPVRTFPQQDAEQVSKEREVDSGKRCLESFARFDPASCSLKTLQCSLLADSTESLQTLPRQGMMRHGWCSERMMLVPPMFARESGYLHMIPTPTACNAPNKGSNTKGPKSLLEVARSGWMPGQVWPTPTVHGNNNRAELSPKSGDGLATAVRRQMWPSPKARDATAGGISAEMRRHSPSLPAMVKMYPTPTCQDAKNNGSPSQAARNTPPLNVVVKYGTPTATSHARSERFMRNGTPTPVEMYGGQLSPLFVEWLMGWTLAWTDLRPWGTDRFQWWQRWRSVFCTAISLVKGGEQ